MAPPGFERTATHVVELRSGGSATEDVYEDDEGRHFTVVVNSDATGEHMAPTGQMITVGDTTLDVYGAQGDQWWVRHDAAPDGGCERIDVTGAGVSLEEFLPVAEETFARTAAD